MDFVKIHVLALEQYDAVIMYDMQRRQDHRLRCVCAVTVL